MTHHSGYHPRPYLGGMSNNHNQSAKLFDQGSSYSHGKGVTNLLVSNWFVEPPEASASLPFCTTRPPTTSRNILFEPPLLLTFDTILAGCAEMSRSSFLTFIFNFRTSGLREVANTKKDVVMDSNYLSTALAPFPFAFGNAFAAFDSQVRHFFYFRFYLSLIHSQSLFNLHIFGGTETA
jgi:hypothetical protein